MSNLQELLLSPLFSLTLTAGSYLLGQKIYKLSRCFPLLHPVLMAVIPVIVILHLTGLDYLQYREGTEFFTLLLGTATVALAVPLYQQLHLIRTHARALMWTLVLGAIFTPAVALGLGWISGATEVTLLSLAPKSVTTPIAIAVAESIGGLATVAAGTVICAGIVGAVIAPPLMSRMGIHNPAVRGFTMGLTAHAAGTARAFEISPVSGAFASLGLALTGALTAFTMPLAWELIKLF
ncbi:LrgB family protein [Sansalvadorimonas sp. 2012CJ34-2]|uniref:LrgB family protein n=1 Tax=Parendozoicomonas callyspongiae TaxID=2942213 RepID=A0ABT0PIF7_9GAMM|nr:LrgB family protein [Sansalvadorimonas sp. 2012CJ34-2]MCL6271175.1 LrgB family protein [Sansalvadorimonas sp. 2012CJ34-2]